MFCCLHLPVQSYPEISVKLWFQQFLHTARLPCSLRHLRSWLGRSALSQLWVKSLSQPAAQVLTTVSMLALAVSWWHVLHQGKGRASECVPLKEALCWFGNGFFAVDFWTGFQSSDRLVFVTLYRCLLFHGGMWACVFPVHHLDHVSMLSGKKWALNINEVSKGWLILFCIFQDSLSCQSWTMMCLNLDLLESILHDICWFTWMHRWKALT